MPEVLTFELDPELNKMKGLTSCFTLKKNTFALGKDFLFVLHFSGPGPPGSKRKFFLNYIYFNVFYNFGYILI